MHLRIEGEARAALLCRIVGIAAQLDLPAPPMRVDVRAETMVVELELRGVAHPLAAVLAEKIARCIGVATVIVDGVAIGTMAPA